MNNFYIASRLAKVTHTESELTEFKTFFSVIQKDVNAQYEFFNYCKDWKLAPWIYSQLKSLELFSNFSQEVQILFSDFAVKIYNENKGRLEEAAKFLHEFQKEDIDVVILKGNAFLSEIYNNLGYKKMNDFDMLIHIKDWVKVQKVYADLKYIPLGFGWGGEKEEVAKFSHTGLSFISPNYRCITGTQWGLKSPTSKYTVNIHDVWNKTEPLTFQNLEVKQLSPEYNLLHLILHMGTYKCGIRDCMDVYNLLLVKTDFNEDLFIEICKESNAMEKAYFTLSLSQLCCNSISQSLIAKLKPTTSSFIIRRLNTRIKMFEKTGDMQLSYNDYFHEVEMIVFYFSLFHTFHKKFALYLKLVKTLFFVEKKAAYKLSDLANDASVWQKFKARLQAPYYVFSLIGEEIGVGITILLFIKMLFDSLISIKNYALKKMSYFQFLKKEGIDSKEIISVVKGIQ